MEGGSQGGWEEGGRGAGRERVGRWGGGEGKEGGRVCDDVLRTSKEMPDQFFHVR